MTKQIHQATERGQVRTTGGFTLIEIMIVVAIVGIIATVAVPSYENAVRKSRRAEARTALAQAIQMEERFFSVTKTYTAFSKSSTDPDAMRFSWFSGSSSGDSYYQLDAVACASQTLTDCVKITAHKDGADIGRPTADSQCGDYFLRSDGKRGNSVAGAVGCW